MAGRAARPRHNADWNGARAPWYHSISRITTDPVVTVPVNGRSFVLQQEEVRTTGMSSVSGLLSVQISALILSAAGVLGVVIPVPVMAVIGGRALFALPIVIGSALIRGHRLRPDWNRETAILFFSGLLLAAHWVTYFHAVRVSGVAVASMVVFTFPVITAIAEPIVFRERFYRHTVVHAVLVVVGIVFVSEALTGSEVAIGGVFWGLVSACAYTVRNLLSRNAATGRNIERVMTIQFAVVALVLAYPLVTSDLAGLSRSNWIAFVALGIFQTGIGHTVFLRSLNRIGAAVASISVSVQPIYAAILAAIFLGQIPTIFTVIGAVFILTAVMREGILAQRRAIACDSL